jgi:hypothetical protein
MAEFDKVATVSQQNDEVLNRRQTGRIILRGTVVTARTGLKPSGKVN